MLPKDIQAWTAIRIIGEGATLAVRYRQLHQARFI